ncbi:MAG: protein kinase, partial [Thermoanaerobaculia bacterium]|nr:protein kinase [Thermoanaerobaculia bacterium]
MSLSAGSRLGSFEIVSPLGKGGMGEVWRAHDPKLGRDVAIKVLPPEFTADAERLARFDREARLLASINHPHIAAIYGLEDTDDQKFIVMELAEGETLADRLARGAIPLDEAIAIARQIAQALEAAHEKGIVHRDLKPGNVVVDLEGNVRVLDFGLAKALDADAASDSDITNSPTMVRAATGAGVILGTAAYMSPEQARGKRVDRRADIWAFGVVLWEMLAGRRMFRGETISDTLAAVLTAPVDFEALPDGTPPGALWTLSRCLERDPKLRLRDIGEARVALDQGLPAVLRPEAGVPHQKGNHFRRTTVAVVLALIAGAVLALFLEGFVDDEVSTPSVIRASIGVEPAEGVDLGPSLDLPGIAISPDSTMIAFTGSEKGESRLNRRLYIRHLDHADATPLSNTEGARAPFFTYDGQSVAYEVDGRLFVISARGGTPYEVPIPSIDVITASSAADGSFLVAGLTEADRAAIVRVYENGNRIETIKEFAEGTRSGWTPRFLPGERAILFTSYSEGERALVLLDLESEETRVIHPEFASGIWSDSGHILYSTGGRIDALPFSLQSLEPTGPPATIRENLSTGFIVGGSQFDLSRSGTLITISGDSVRPRTDSLLWFSPGLRMVSIGAPPYYYADPRLSPDGRFLAVSVPTEDNDIWVRDLERGTQSRLSFAPGEDETPVWSPDGRSVYWSAQREKERKVLRRNADGSGSEEEIWSDSRHHHLAEMSPDGSTILID